MPEKTSAYEPRVLVETADLPEEEWLEWRRRGIGGSDAAAILGVSPFATACDLYYDKLKIVSYEDPESNWVQKKMGHLLEDLVAEIFHRKTGYRIYQIKKMFYHPEYPYMLADIDYFIELPNGKTAILEIKTTNYNAKDHWWRDGEEIVPINYEIQGRHYMCVMNVDEVYYCCLYGNNENEVIIRHIERDLDYEAELIALEGEFWHGNVETRTPPPYTEDGELILESVKNHYGPADTNSPQIELSSPASTGLIRYLELREEKSAVKSGNQDPEVENPAGKTAEDCRGMETATWEKVADSMIYDLYLRENLKSHPSFEYDQKPYEKAVWEYRRQEKVPKTAHIEVFRDGKILLFDYENRDPLLHNAAVKEIQI